MKEDAKKKKSAKRKTEDGSKQHRSKKAKARDGGVTHADASEPQSQVMADATAQAGSAVAGAAVKKSRLDPDTLTYLHEIETHFKTLVDDESKELLVSNVLEELSGKELRVVSDAEGSRIVEVFIQSAPAPQLINFLNAFNDTDSLYRVSGSPFGSHTLEKVLRALRQHVERLDEDTYAQVEQLVSTLVGAVEGSLYDYLMDRNAAHFPRQLLNFITGREVIPSAKAAASAAATGWKGAAAAGLAAKLSTTAEPELAPVAFPEALQRLCEVVLGDGYRGSIMEDLAGSPTAGPFLQGLLRAAQGNSELLGRLVPAMLGAGALQPGAVVEDRGRPLDGLDEEHVRSFLEHSTASRLVEVVVAVAPPEIYADFFARFLAGHASRLAAHPAANFVLQAAIAAAKKPAQVKALVVELAGELKELFRRRRAGVVAALAAASARLKAGQSELTRALAAALAPEVTNQHAKESEDAASGVNARLVRALVCLDCTVELGKPAGTGPSGRLSTLGCATLASVLHFSQATCRQFVKGLLALPQEQLLHLCMDPSGSRVVEAFLDSEAQIGQKRGLVRKLQGSYAHIALKSFGSFLMEKCYEWADLDLKASIVGELVESDKQLNATHWGPFLLRKVSADVYQRDPAQWRRRAQAASQVLSEFAEIFGSDAGPGRKGKAGNKPGDSSAPAATGKKKREGATENGAPQEDPNSGRKRRRGGNDQSTAAGIDAGAAAVGSAQDGDGGAIGAGAGDEQGPNKRKKKKKQLNQSALPDSDVVRGQDHQDDRAKALVGDDQQCNSSKQATLQTRVSGEKQERGVHKKKKKDTLERAVQVAAQPATGLDAAMALLGFPEPGLIAGSKDVQKKKKKKHLG